MAPVVSKGKTQEVCSHCSKPGHTETKCYQKHPELKPTNTKDNPEQSGTSSSPKGATEKRGTYTSRTRPSYPAKHSYGPRNFCSRGQSSFCLAHGVGRHSSDQCHTLKNMLKEKELSKPSGEASRQVSKKPD